MHRQQTSTDKFKAGRLKARLWVFFGIKKLGRFQYTIQATHTRIDRIGVDIQIETAALLLDIKFELPFDTGKSPAH